MDLSDSQTPAGGTPPPQRSPASPFPTSLRRVGIVVAAALFGGLTGLATLSAYIAWSNRQALPRLEPDRFQEARRTWESEGPDSYNVEVVVQGRQAATYYVEVREGKVTLATRNGHPLRQQRTMGTWSVPGMFGTIGSDVRHLREHRAGTADELTPQVLLRAAFDERYGYPLRYLRTELQQWGSNQEVSWQTSRFEVIDEST